MTPVYDPPEPATIQPDETVVAALHRPVLRETRKDNFNAIRLALAIGVLLSHSFPMVGAQEPVLMGHTLGNFCVHVFFALSGYMVSQSFVRSRSIIRYAVHRVLRIIPALIISMLFSNLLAHWLGHFATNPIPYIVNGSLWTIPWEILCYVLVGVAGTLGILAAPHYRAFFAAVLVFAFADGSWSNQSYLVLMPLMLVFAIGAFLAIYEDTIAINRAAVAAAVAAVLVQTEPSQHLVQWIVDSILWLWGPGNGNLVVYNLLYVFAVPVLALWCGRYAPPVLATRVDLSYGAYLYAWPVQQAVVTLFVMEHWTLHPLVLFVIALLGTLSLAWPSWVLIERPALRLKSVNRHSFRLFPAKAGRS
jgi:peptidoglycan/LPS O-acetylase OafA/YrhL